MPGLLDNNRRPVGLLGTQGNGLMGYKIRQNLFPGEDSYFSNNPHVAGMAAETNDIILNPYSPQGVNHDAVAKNEAMRLRLREQGVTPAFPVTDMQRASFEGTSYGGQEGPMRETIAARIYSGDPSARATPEQQQWVNDFIRRMGR